MFSCFYENILKMFLKCFLPLGYWYITLIPVLSAFYLLWSIISDDEKVTRHFCLRNIWKINFRFRGWNDRFCIDKHVWLTQKIMVTKCRKVRNFPYKIHGRYSFLWQSGHFAVFLFHVTTRLSRRHCGVWRSKDKSSGFVIIYLKHILTINWLFWQVR